MELLGNSEVLKCAFIALRTEVEWFCKSTLLIILS